MENATAATGHTASISRPLARRKTATSLVPRAAPGLSLTGRALKADN
jgi:hypothetical protein